VKADSLFEIGSITKTFTGLILAQMVEQGKIRLDEPVRELLPKGTVEKPASGGEITLLDLATQHSGLPRMPDNFDPNNPEDPYADYDAQQLYAFIGKRGVTRPADARFNYSNLGFGLLGQALSNAAGSSYAQLLADEVTLPLGMKTTVVTLSTDQRARFAQGHGIQHQPTHEWNLNAMAGAGAIRSTAGDMLTYLHAQLHPEKVDVDASLAASRTIAKAIQMSHEIRAEAGPSMKIALAWLFNEQTGTYWHNGGTGGFSSYAYFNPREDVAAVVLCNTSVGPNGSFADRLGEHIAERLRGTPAIELEP
jgi:CubicO group peptidase (beta-lactamase class C family)